MSPGPIMVVGPRYSNQTVIATKIKLGLTTREIVFGCELQFVLSGVLPMFQGLIYKLHRRLSDLLPIHQMNQCHQS